MYREFHIEGQQLASIDIPPGKQLTFPVLWYCQACGEVYARFPVFDRPTGPGCWQCRAGCCSKCKPGENFLDRIPGSVWGSYIGDNQYSKEVMQRELLLLIDDLEKRLNYVSPTTDNSVL